MQIMFTPHPVGSGSLVASLRMLHCELWCSLGCRPCCWAWIQGSVFFFTQIEATVMSLICSHMDSKLPQSAISALIWASWMKSRSAAVCAYVCVRAKAREISQFLSTNLCKELYCSPAVQKLKIKIWSSSASLSTVWTSSPGVTPDQLTSRSWVSFRRCLVWLVSLSKSVWIRRGWAGKADANRWSWANSSERSSDEEESPSTAEESKSLMHSKQHSYVRPKDPTPLLQRDRVSTRPHKAHRESQPEDKSFIFLGEGNHTCCITLEEEAVRWRCSAPWASNTWSIITVDMINASLMN